MTCNSLQNEIESSSHKTQAASLISDARGSIRYETLHSTSLSQIACHLSKKRLFILLFKKVMEVCSEVLFVFKLPF